MSSSKPVKNDLYDQFAERVVLAGLIQYGAELYYEYTQSLKEQHFNFPENKIIYSALSTLINDDQIKNPTIASISAKINSIDKALLAKYDFLDYLAIITSHPVTKEEIKPLATRISKFGLARELIAGLKYSISEIETISGEESMLEIINAGEGAFMKFTENLITANEVSLLPTKLEAFIDYLAEHKPKVRGIASGYPRYDRAIGGGFRRSGVHLVGARSGGGKTFFGLNVANYVSSCDIPVLYLDTELTEEFTLGRWAALVTDVPIDVIETGQFTEDQRVEKLVREKIKEVEDRPFSYFNISGKPYTEWLSIMRRWVMQTVGFQENGSANPCLIILDYIKVMDQGELGKMDEWRYLGQIITDLHNFTVKYDLPLLSLVQLNRDGIHREDQGVMAGSDRLVHLCSSFAIMKNKADEDFAEDPEENGNKKLVIPKGRFGPGTKDGEYINLKCDLSRSKIIEGYTNLENRHRKTSMVKGVLENKVAASFAEPATEEIPFDDSIEV